MPSHHRHEQAYLAFNKDKNLLENLGFFFDVNNIFCI
jgi:hypothetical protein